MGPALLGASETVAIDAGIIADADAVKDLRRQDGIQRGVILVATEQKQPLAIGGEGPQRTTLVADFPAGLVHVDDGGVGNQLAQSVELLIPVMGQLPQQRIGLRFGQRQLTKETEHGTSFVQRNANDVDQEGEHHQDFDAVFAAWRDAGDAWFGATSSGEDAIADAHGPAVFEAPDGAFADELAIFVSDAVGIDVFGAIGVGEFEGGGFASRRFFAASAFALSATFFFGVEAIGGNR